MKLYLKSIETKDKLKHNITWSCSFCFPAQIFEFRLQEKEKELGVVNIASSWLQRKAS